MLLWLDLNGPSVNLPFRIPSLKDATNIQTITSLLTNKYQPRILQTWLLSWSVRSTQKLTPVKEIMKLVNICNNASHTIILFPW